MSKKIWKRYLTREIGKVFFFAIFASYLLLIIVDASIHLQAITTKLPFSDLCMYYLSLFSKRAHFFFAFSMAIATPKILCNLNERNELLAFQTGGLSLFSLTRPFFFIALSLPFFLCRILNTFFQLLLKK